jgi:hypothetical protein
LKTQHITPLQVAIVRAERGMLERSAKERQRPNTAARDEASSGGGIPEVHGKTAIIRAEDETNSLEQDTLTAYRLEHRSSEEQFCGGS